MLSNEIYEKRQKDFILGFTGEDEVIQILREKMDPYIKPCSQFNLFDFETCNCLYELKTRRCNHNTYNDTMIGMNKILYAQNNLEKDIFFIFNYKDGLYYWKFNIIQPLNYRYGGRSDRGSNEYKEYAFIPISYLTKL